MGGIAASSDVFRAVADATRRQILAALRESEHSVEELRRPFRISQPSVSKHLKILQDAGLVKARRQGRHSFYKLNPKPLEEVYEWARQFREFSDPSGHVWRMVARSKTVTRRK